MEVSELFNDSDNHIDYFMDGMIHEHKEDYREAMASYNKVIEICGKSTPAYYKLGVLNQRVGEYDKAIKNYSHVIDCEPEYLAYYKRGICYFESKKYEQAIQDFEKALEIVSATQTDNIYSPVYKCIKKVVWTKFATLFPREEKVLRLKLGIGSFNDENLGNITVVYDGQLLVDKTYLAKLIYRYLGESYTLNKRNTHAIEYWNKFIEIEQQDSDAYIMRGVCYYKTGNYLYAAGDFAMAIRRDPQNSKAAEKLNKILNRSLNFSRMVQDLLSLSESKGSLTNDDIIAILSSYAFPPNEIDAVASYIHKKVTDIVDE